MDREDLIEVALHFGHSVILSGAISIFLPEMAATIIIPSLLSDPRKAAVAATEVLISNILAPPDWPAPDPCLGIWTTWDESPVFAL
jgi:hypothetical protein